jgi:hypothetical protein
MIGPNCSVGFVVSLTNLFTPDQFFFFFFFKFPFISFFVQISQSNKSLNLVNLSIK